MYNLLGQINFVNYIASFAAGTVHVEDTSHPIFNGVPATFQVVKEEWYTWDNSPRPHVHVLANVDENSYMPPSDIKMGDHPVIWTNPDYKGKNVYIFMGHDPILFDSTEYKTLLRNAIFWAATK
jgi:type 1 glutamine amidotransferase